MRTPPRTQMASYLERWEEQKAQSRLERQRPQRRRSSGVGDELSFISAIERETAQHEPYQADADVLSGQYEEEGDDSFDLPAMDAFPSSELVEQAQEQHKMPADDEFVDAATFIKNNELGGEDSFSQDVGPVTGDNWDQVDSSGRPSDFFERKSRNLDRVELSSPRNVDDPLFEGNIEEDEGEDLGLCKPKQLSPTGARQGVAMHDHFNGSSGVSGSGTAFSSGYDVHFDNTKLMYTPNSLKYLQEKSRFRSANEVRNDSEPDLSVADHTGEAMAVTKKAPSVSDQEIPADPSPEYVANLQRGPGVIKESLDEIDALIENSIRLASAPPAKDPLGVELSEDMREFVRDYERPLESMLPLSRTTDSWEEDVSMSIIDDDTSRRSRDLDRLSSGTETGRRATSGVRQSRSQEMPELDTIREVPCPSNINSASQSQRSNESRIRVSKAPQIQNGLVSPTDPSDQGRRARKADRFSGKRFSGINSKRSEGLKSRATSVTLDQSLADVAATQNPFRDEAYHPETNDIGYGSADDDIHNVGDYYDTHGDNERCVNGKATPDQYAASKSGEADLNGARFHYRESTPVVLRSLTKKKPVDDQRRGMNSCESRSAAVQKQPAPSDRFLDVMERNTLHVTMEAAMIPRRCRRFLCSIGDIMTEQIVFTNGTNSVGRICVSLLPLSTGCQQFSVSPAVLELGPKASNAFHVTFNARYAGAVSGIFQFRGVGVESLFHPYEVVIEASVRRHTELEAPRSARATQSCKETDTNERVQELQASASGDQVEVSPMFIRFDQVQNKSGEMVIKKAKLRLANNTAQTLPFKVQALENLKVRPATGMIQPASEVIVSVLPISQPFVQQRTGGDASSNNPTSKAKDWLGSLTVRVGEPYLREVSVVVDRQVIQRLPPFDEIARSRHQISSQTDSFYYTKRGKRRGLYFHARAVEFGCCNVGESHEVPVYVCNGSKTPMTVLLQDLQEPFSCAYTTTTIEPRKFIEVMVTFTPKVVGKVATSLFAYSVTDKAVVTLVARGI